MTTRPLPAVQALPSAPPGRALRGVELMAGLAGGGLLLLGLILLGLQLLAPQLVSDATGPGWGTVSAHLAVGAVAETGRGLRARWVPGVRAGAAVLTILAVIGILALCWWR